MKRDLTVLKAILKADYQRHLKKFELLKPGKPIVFIGDSIVAYFPLKKYGLENHIDNLGIPGDTSKGVYERLYQVYALKPKQVILHVGINDEVLLPYQVENTVKQIQAIIDDLKEHLPHAKIYIVSLTPINLKDFPNSSYVLHRNAAFAMQINQQLKQMQDVQYIDIYPSLSNFDHVLYQSYTTDGIHLNDQGYATYWSILQDIVNFSI